MTDTPKDRFLSSLEMSLTEGGFAKLTLSRPVGQEPTLKNLFVRPVSLKAGPRLAFLWRHDTKDITKNLDAREGLEALRALIGPGFQSAHLFTTTQTLQFEVGADGREKVRQLADAGAQRVTTHDREKQHVIDPQARWLRELGVTNDQGRPQKEMTGKFRQIEKFAELLQHLISEAPLPDDRPWAVTDMGCGKGYLTFATAALLGPRARVVGIELRPALVEASNRLAHACSMQEVLSFRAGAIEDSAPEKTDVLIALHACDTATDDALASGVASQASLIVVSPCCQKELRGQLASPEVLAPALRHGIFQERQAEFVTDALRALLLEWAGYRTKVFEFISTEHTAKNLMIAAIRASAQKAPDMEEKIRAFAHFYGIRKMALATALGFELSD